MRFSIIIPVYNRPDEVDELLESLTRQTFADMEVVIVEDGSTLPCSDVVDRYRGALDIRYIRKENSGQGFSRNTGFEQAKGEIWILMDSDCIAPPTYLEEVDRGMRGRNLDAFGGPDMAHDSFTDVQKAIDYAMTSFFTTGGIRNRTDGLDHYLARSFNMGFRREVIGDIGGFRITRMGEDLDLSVRIVKAGFRMGLIPGAFVYHKRRTDLRAFARQLHFFGRARINLWRFHRDQLRWVHLMPSAFLLDVLLVAALWAWALLSPSSVWIGRLAALGTVGMSAYSILIWWDARRKLATPRLATLALAASWIQLTSYGAGLLREAATEAAAMARRRLGLG